jgi:hypothetical protein
MGSPAIDAQGWWGRNLEFEADAIDAIAPDNNCGSKDTGLRLSIATTKK